MLSIDDDDLEENHDAMGYGIFESMVIGDADESGHEAVRELDGIIVAQIARVEVPAAIWRKHRTGELSSPSAGVLIAEFEADWFGTDDRRGGSTLCG